MKEMTPERREQAVWLGLGSCAALSLAAMVALLISAVRHEDRWAAWCEDVHGVVVAGMAGGTPSDSCLLRDGTLAGIRERGLK